MKILVLDEAFPFPLDTGKRIRSFHLTSRLASAHDVRYLAYGEPDSESFDAMKRVGIKPLAVPPQVPPKKGLAFYGRLLANLKSPYPYMVTSHYSELFAAGLKAALEANPPDLIICEWTPYAIYVKDISGPTKLIVAHNIEHRIWQRYYDNERLPHKKWFIGKQREKLERFERAAFGWVDGVTAVSQKEADDIAAMRPGLQVEPVENGVDLEYFDSTGQEPDNRELVFVGAMNWRPNQDAVEFFADDILPLVRQKIPEVGITFVGQQPPDHIRKIARLPGVKVPGRVDDVRPYVVRSAVFVVPLRIGGGTRLKILEAMAMRKAIVSTSVGAEGLEVTDGTNIMLADSPADFADRVVQLLQDQPLRARLGEAGRELVESTYGWDRLFERLDRFLHKLVNRT